MVKVMPNQKSVSVLPRSFMAAIGGVFLLLGAAGIVRADDASSDDFFSTIFSTYGITLLLLLLLVGLIVFKKIRAKQEDAEFESGKPQTSRSARSSTP